MDDITDRTYRQLTTLAERIHSERGRPASLFPTDLLHEAWLKLDDRSRYNDRVHFIAVAARAMRQVIIDRARARTAAKRGGGAVQTTLTGLGEGARTVDIVALNDALTKLESIDAECALVVVHRLLAGMSVPEIVDVTGMSKSRVERHWRFGRALLARELAG